MAEPKTAPCGSWESPITSDMIASKMTRLGQIALEGEDIYWDEMRPSEGGRYVIVRHAPDGGAKDVIPAPFNARTRVHEYGGGAYVVDKDRETVIFSRWDDQRLYRQRPGKEPQPITPETEMRYADGIIDRQRERLICVREDHTADGEPVNALVSVALDGSGEMTVLASGNDFYSSPRLNPDGIRLAWLTWNHPNMPWNGTELWVGDLEADGALAHTERAAGGPEESIFQPEWSPEGTLYFVSDRTGWWNLYRWRDEQVEPLTEMEAEFGRPQWGFGMSTYDFESAHRIICAYTKEGIWHLASLDTTTRELTPIETHYTNISQVRARPGQAVFRGGSPTEPTSIVRLDLATGETKVLRRSGEQDVDTGYLAAPQAIDFPTGDGATAHGLFYPPKNRDYVGPDDELPPLVVISHGGPTAVTSSTLDLELQYWTSRGFAVLDVNYRGSTGYGRAYREELEGEWGIADVADCINGARHLVEQGEADGERLIIRGGSAGGYTTLCALAFHHVFEAGASYYGVSDLEALTKYTHKFESRYLDRLVGPYPERQDLYRERSPIHSTDQLSCPVIFFQGLEDQVVPPDQAETMVEALQEKGLPVAYVPFEGEQHGLRQAESIKRALDAELYFYSRVFGFELAEAVEPAHIDNL